MSEWIVREREREMIRVEEKEMKREEERMGRMEGMEVNENNEGMMEE